jgi:2-methylcitrate dehydratase
MQRIDLAVHPSAACLPKEFQLAWKIAEYATSEPRIDAVVAEAVADRIVDSLAVATAALGRAPVAAAREMAVAHPRTGGGGVFGLPVDVRVHAEWAAWANGVAVRELDFNDTFLAADFSHPSDTIAPLLATAQQTGRGGDALARAIAVAYEVQIALVKAIDLHSHKKDHVAHLAPAVAAGLGALLDLPTEAVYQAINQSVHLAFATRQSRKGEISSWKAYAPAWAGKTAIEATDRAMRGEGAPNPIWEGEDSVLAWMLGGPEARHTIVLPEPGESPRLILESYPKAHSAEYQAQAIVDLAIELHGRLDLAQVRGITLHTSDHTHRVIGTGSNDPQKLDPEASRETLDHSIMYILAVALEDGRWHHEASYARERARRPSTVALWHRIETREDPEWTARYHADDPAERAFGGRLVVEMADGGTIEAAKAVADAHPNGARPWGRADFAAKLETLAEGVLADGETRRLLALTDRLCGLEPAAVRQINPLARAEIVGLPRPSGRGIFDHA